MSHEEVPHGEGIAQLHGVHRLSRSCEYAMEVEKQLVTVTFGKKVTAGDIERYAGRLRTNPSFQPSFSEIVDLSQVEELDLQAAEFMKLADEIDPFSPDAKRAFVARSATQNHAARMHKILRTQRNIEIFPSVEEAERWIKG